MKAPENNLKEKEFLATVEHFFDARNVNSYLTFTDHWMEELLGKKLAKNRRKPSERYDVYGLISELFEQANDLANCTEGLSMIEHSAKVNLVFLTNEKHVLDYFPYQLKQKELLNPVLVILKTFRKITVKYYLKTLKEWVKIGLSSSYAAENADLIVPLYQNIKRIISACWLIHERAISKNSYQVPSYQNAILNFALTAPSLFTPQEIKNPFSVIEFFFNYTNLSGYREELQKYYIAAINEDQVHENPSTSFFIHNQYISLIQAGFIIVSNNLKYVAKVNEYGGKTLGQWMLNVRDRQVKEGEIEISDEAVQVLKIQERADPMLYCKQTLTYENVIKLRFCLKECFDAGLHNRSCIENLDQGEAYELYLTLQKLTEAFYLIITADARNTI